MTEQLIVKAINKLRPNSEFSFVNNDYSTIKWDKLKGDVPTLAEIEAAVAEIVAEDNLLATQRLTNKAALLERLGITADEAALLLS